MALCTRRQKFGFFAATGNFEWPRHVGDVTFCALRGPRGKPRTTREQRAYKPKKFLRFEGGVKTTNSDGRGDRLARRLPRSTQSS